MEKINEYKLKTRDGEVVNKCKCHTLNDAIEYFAWCKDLSEDNLLQIFDISLCDESEF